MISYKSQQLWVSAIMMNLLISSALYVEMKPGFGQYQVAHFRVVISSNHEAGKRERVVFPAGRAVPIASFHAYNTRRSRVGFLG